MDVDTSTEQFLAAAARANARSTGRRITGNDALDWAGTVTAVLTTVGDGINVPQLKLAAGLAKQVIEVIQTVRENKKGALELGQQTFEYTRVIIETYHKPEGKETGAFQTSIENFNDSLEKILSTLKKIALRKAVKRLLRYQKDKRRIEDAKSDLQHAFQRFNLAKYIIVVQDVQETKAQTISLGVAIQDAVKELDAGISQTNIGIEAVRAQVSSTAQTIERTRDEVLIGATRIEAGVENMLFDVQRTVSVVLQTQGEVRAIRMALHNAQDLARPNVNAVRKELSTLKRDIRDLAIINGSCFFFADSMSLIAKYEISAPAQDAAISSAFC